MASPFDGMTGALTGVFGEDVTLTDLNGSARSVKAVFRETPIEIEIADGRITQIVAPTLRVRRDLVPSVARDWIVSPARVAPRRFGVLQVWPSGSPADDAFVICEIEEIE
jgi:hypothetical protein